MKIPELGKDRAYLVIEWPKDDKFMSLDTIRRKFKPEFKHHRLVQIKQLCYIKTVTVKYSRIYS